MNIFLLLKDFVNIGASDLHLVANLTPYVRIDGKLKVFKDEILSVDDIEKFCFEILSQAQIDKFLLEKELDLAFVYDSFRFRVNFYYSNSKISAVFRAIATKIPALDELKSPKILKDLVKREKGLILITGATGSGKSTTLAAMLNEINEHESRHILTIEDPVEFIHAPKKSLFSHRSIGDDTISYENALKYALREDPDVILIGELRDTKSMEAAISIAETGHLVFATLHTNSAVSSINRIIDSFSQTKQALVQSMLSTSLLAVVSQNLIPKIGGGRVCIYEILINNQAISNLIREGKIHQIYSQMQLGQAQSSMQTQTQAIISALNRGDISKDDALRYANNIQELNLKVGM